MSKHRNLRLTRQQSLQARPVAAVLRREDLPEGGQRLTVNYRPTGMQRWLLRIPDTATRQYDLDRFGVQVLDLCDGKHSVQQIIQTFVKEHQLGEQEAERAVLTFLRSLMSRGVVAMAVDK